MFKNHFIIQALLSLLLLAPHHLTQADDDYIEAKHLLKSGEILPLEIILENVRKSYPGKILDVELEKKDKNIVYEIEILTENGIVKELYINARNGTLISIKDDN